MANDDTSSIIANWPPGGLTLEPAIERLGSLIPVYAAAAAAYHDICFIRSSFRARHPQANHSDLSPYTEKVLQARKELDAQKEIFSRFLALLTAGVLIVAIRPFSDLGASLKLLRPNETSQLTIEVHHSQNSLMLYGPECKELYALFLRQDMAHMVPPRNALLVEFAATPSQPAKVALTSTVSGPPFLQNRFQRDNVGRRRLDQRAQARTPKLESFPLFIEIVVQVVDTLQARARMCEHGLTCFLRRPQSRKLAPDGYGECRG
jgi:hypothetical protein